MANCLLNYGIRSGDRIGICCENQFEYCYLAFGTIFIGATLTTVSPFFTDSKYQLAFNAQSDFNVALVRHTQTIVELQHTFGLSKPNVVFVSPSTVDKMHKLRTETSYIRDMFIFGTDKRCKSFETFLSDPKVPPAEDFECPPQDMATNVAVIFSSSGTTGPSKGVELTQLNLLSSLQLIPE